MRTQRFVGVVTISMVVMSLASVRAQETAGSAPEGGAAPLEREASLVRVSSEEEAGESLVSMSFDETPLLDVVKAFRDATGANIISGTTNLNARISVSLDNVPWRKGLNSILDTHDFQLVEQPLGSGIYVVLPKTVVIPRITRTFVLDYAKAKDVAELFGRMVTDSGGAVTAFKESNAIVLTGTEQQVAECEVILKTIDKPMAQVYIEVRFAELTAAASKKLGLKWDTLDGWTVSTKDVGAGMARNKSRLANWQAPTTKDQEGKDVLNYLVPGEYTAAPNAGFEVDDMTWRRVRGIGGQLTAQDFALTLSAFEQMDGVSIFSNPKIIVANEKEAVVDMTTKEPNVTVRTSRTGTAGDQLDISAQLEVIPGEKGDKDGAGRGLFAGEAFFSYGLSLKVTPRISPTGLITVNVEPSISNLKKDDPYYTFEGVDEKTPTPKYPKIDMQRLQTVFSMQSGTTAVIGGLSKTIDSNIDSGIPLMREIPWVGPRLFGWKSRLKDQREIVIFMTVGIANPVEMTEDVGMPKNAVLGREILSGALKEPGDRTKAELFSLDDEAIFLPSSRKGDEASEAPLLRE